MLLKAQLLQNISASLTRADGLWFLPGFEGAVFECDLSTAAALTQAVVATPEAIVGAIVLPPNLQRGEIAVEPIELPGIGQVAWLTQWVSLEVVCGFAPGNPLAARFVAST